MALLFLERCLRDLLCALFSFILCLVHFWHGYPVSSPTLHLDNLRLPLYVTDGSRSFAQSSLLRDL